MKREVRLDHSIHGNVLNQSEVLCLRRGRNLIATFPILAFSKKACFEAAVRIAESRGISKRTHIEVD